MDRIWIIAAAAVLALLLLVSVAAAFIRGETEFEPGTAEAAVQRYLRALVERDYDAAHALWSPDLRERCSIETFVTDTRHDLDRLADSRLTLGEVRTAGEVTTVEVESTHTSDGGIFGPSEYTRSEIFSLRMHDGAWLIARHTYPWIKCVSESPTPKPPPTSVMPRIETKQTPRPA